MARFETTLTLKDETATAELAARIAGGLAVGDVVALSGDLGAGKTALARGILRARGVVDHVPSPTFTLVQAYETPGLMVHHFDLYRIEEAKELAELGLDDALSEGAALVEWPERGVPSHLLEHALNISLNTVDETTREAHISAPARWRDLLGGAAT